MSHSPPELFDTPDDASACARAERWFAEEPSAILACAIAVARSSRAPSPAITRAAAAGLDALGRAAPAAVRDALTEVLVSPGAHLALEWLHAAGALLRLLPEVEATVNFSQEAGRKHKDVWEHTKTVVVQAPPSPAVRWGALLHDIGKVPTRTFTPDGKVHFHGHAEVGARMFDAIARRLAFDPPLRKKVRFLILHHLRANQYAPSWTDSAVRRFDREMAEHLDDLLALSRADITSRRPGRRQALLQQIDALAARILALRELDAKQPPLPTGLGTAISERFGIPPSRRIGELKQVLEEAVELGELEERREPSYYLEWLAARGLT